MSKAIFVDLDGTVRKTRSGRVAPGSPDDQEILEGRHEALWDYKNQGFRIIAVSNQAGVAKGYMSNAAVQHCLHDLNLRLKGVFDDMLYCASAPDSGDPRRKPGIGMLLEAKEKYDLDFAKCIMTGDMESDKECAEKAGVKFVWAKDFFETTGNEDEDDLSRKPWDVRKGP